MPKRPAQLRMVDFPASYHNGAGGLSFADGHAEIRRWLHFEDGVPAEYAWIPEAEHQGKRDFRYCYDMSFAEWAAMEKREAESGTGHAGPKPTGEECQ